MVEELTKESFIDKISSLGENFDYKGDKPAVIDFWAPWCSPCKQVTPIIEALSEEYNGKIDFYKINTDDESELASVFNIQSIPSILFIPQGGDPRMSVGALPKTAFKKAFKDLFDID